MNILVVGATGILGRNVIPRLWERGHKVRALVRREEQARFFRQQGVEAVTGDLFDRKSLERATHEAQLTLHLATTFPRDGSQDWSLNDRVWLEGTHNLLAALRDAGVRRYVQQSSILVYGEKGEEIMDESAPLQVNGLNRSAIEMEAMVHDSGLEWSILRGGLLYGPGTRREDDWWQSARQAALRIPGDGKDWISLVHVVDMACAVVEAAERMPFAAGKIYNIVDDEPVRLRDLFRYIAAQVGASQPQMGAPRLLPSLGVRNIKAQLELAWRPAYPNYRIGLAYGQWPHPTGAINSVASSDAAQQMQAEVVS